MTYVKTRKKYTFQIVTRTFHKIMRLTFESLKSLAGNEVATYLKVIIKKIYFYLLFILQYSAALNRNLKSN